MAKKTQKSSDKWQKLLNLLKDRKLRLLVGVVVFFIVAYVSVALGSFIVTGKADQSVLAEYKAKSVEYHTIRQTNEHTEAIKDDLRSRKEEMRKVASSVQNVTGFRGAVLAERLCNGWFGVGVFSLCVFGFVLSLWIFGVKRLSIWKWFLATVFIALWVSLLMAFTVDRITQESFIKFGGDFGISLRDDLIAQLGQLGLLMILVATGLIFSILTISGTIPFFKNLYKKVDERRVGIFAKKSKTDGDESLVEGEDSVKVGENILPEDWVDGEVINPNPSGEEIYSKPNEPNQSEGDEPLDVEFEQVPATDDISVDEDFEVDDEGDLPVDGDEADEDDEFSEVFIEPYDPRRDLSTYVIPSYTDTYKSQPLLKQYPEPDEPQSEDDKTSNRRRIVDTLKQFGIGVKKIYETIGPTITLYEIVPEDGVRISKIRNLESDIMLSLAATGIRIIAPIPGKGTIGIEVPNSNPQIVSMYNTIASKRFQESKYELPVALGRTITNEVFMFDLTKMPHLLVAGATGQGKSVGLNAIITSLLFKKHPSELKFVLIDPKKVEFNIYSDIEKHFLAKLPDEEEPVITDVEKVKQTLNSLCKEMDDRYDLLKLAHARNVREYNEKFISRRLNPQKGHHYMPYIVVVIDEFGDLIMTAGKEVELPIARIAQLARAVGIHMIIATQRPSVNIITGVIKANFPARIAFKVSSGVDSKTILDGPGAQQLIGRGDLLFSQGNEPTRVQCAFVDTPEVENIVHFISSQQSYTSAFPLPEPDSEGGEQKNIDLTKRDSLFDEVARYVVSSQQGSISNIQRNFEIGFNRAGKIVDQLEAAGIVGPVRGSKPREVLIQTEYDLEKLLKELQKS